MRRNLTASLLLATLVMGLAAVTQASVGGPSRGGEAEGSAVGPNGAGAPPRIPRAPAGFFGIGPQAVFGDEDAAHMRAGGIRSVRWPVPWNGVQPTGPGDYLWGGIDQIVEVAARRRIAVLPFVYGTPSWIARKPTTLPVSSARQRRAWAAFLRAAVERYGPGGEFWREHGPRSDDPLPPQPIRTWQIWNEANFFYFAFPASPIRYARLLRASARTIRRVDPRATVVVSGLFGDPDEGGRRGMAATDFLERLYRVPGIKASFDGVALHPYAVDAETLAELSEEVRDIVLDNHDRRTALYITEMGWGSEDNYEQVAFEQGIRGQVRQLRRSYMYLLRNRVRLNLRGTYWFSWKDLPGSCSFCDSVGLFRDASGFRPKPAWHAFVRLAGGRPRP